MTPRTSFWETAREVFTALQLGENGVGYCMGPDRTDDCLRPAIATVLQALCKRCNLSKGANPPSAAA